MNLPRGLHGTGYQWKQYPSFCRAAAIEAGDLSDCPSNLWFWLLALGTLGIAIFAPVKRGAQ